MKWIIISLIIFTVAMIGASLIITEKMQEKNILPKAKTENLMSYSLGEGVNPDNSQSSTFYTPSSETTCRLTNRTHKICTSTNYGRNVFVDREGNTLTDSSEFTFDGNQWTINFNGTTTYIKPLMEASDDNISLTDYKSREPSVSVSDTREIKRFDYKYALEFSNVPTLTVTPIDCMYFEIINNTNNLDISFQDLIDNNFVVSDVRQPAISLSNTRKEVIQVCNLTGNNRLGTITLDPLISLDAGNYTSWSRGAVGSRATVKYGFHIGLDITYLPAMVGIINATIWFEDQCMVGGLCLNLPDNDYNISLYNATELALGNWNNWHNKITNTTVGTWMNSSGGSSFWDGMEWGFNATDYFKQRYNGGFNNITIRVLDHDKEFENITGESKDSSLFFGGFGSTVNFASPQHTNVSKRPYFVLVYEAEAIPPEITLYFPENGTWINASTPVSGNQFNWTAQVIDDSAIDEAYLWSDFRNDTWRQENIWYGDDTPPLNYTLTVNLTYWFNGKGIMNKNMTGTSGRSMTKNLTHYITTSYGGDKTKVFNQLGENVSMWNNPDGYVYDIDMNDTHIVYADIVSKKIWTTDLSGGNANSCTITETGNPSGIAYDKDNNTYWVIMSTTNDTFIHFDTDCSVIKNMDMLDGSPAYVTRANDEIYWVTWSNYLTQYNITDGSYPLNITDYVPIMGINPTTALGIYAEKNDTFFEKVLMTTSTGYNGITFIHRHINSTYLTWNFKACDIYMNCAWATSNWTWRITNQTNVTLPSYCWTTEPSEKTFHAPLDCYIDIPSILEELQV